jgi:hypothetical protein
MGPRSWSEGWIACNLLGGFAVRHHDLGYAAIEKPTAIHGLHAIMLHQLGVQHDAFTIKFQGLDAKLTGVEKANVIEDIIA